ncbi:MAG TPA: hypothetical protein VMM56_10415 [Planctomycetaceae bacterium]|nr:hypothetical protein [Planctomycetaceae bacterium]
MRSTLPLLMILTTLPTCVFAEISWKTGRQFEQQLEQATSLSTQETPFRELLDRLEQTYEIALILDRRIDPERPISVSVPQANVREMLVQTAQAAGCGIAFLDDLVYFGPLVSADKLRTLVELRQEEFRIFVRNSPAAERSRLISNRSLSWDDFAEPRPTVINFAESYRLQISNPDLIEHDLWAGDTVPTGSFPRTMQLLLFEFDLTFRLDPANKSLELIPIPEKVTLQKIYTLKRNESAESWKKAIPSAQVTVAGNQVTVEGRAEDHQTIDSLRAGRPNTGTVSTTKLSTRRFTLKQKDLPAIRVLEELEKSGIKLDYDAEALKTAGADLEQLIEIDVSDARIEEFLKALLGSFAIEIRIEEETVILRPKSRPE